MEREREGEREREREREGEKEKERERGREGGGVRCHRAVTNALTAVDVLMKMAVGTV